MKRDAVIIGICFCLTGGTLAAQTIAADLSRYEKLFISAPEEYHNYENLSFLISSRYESLTAAQRLHIRSLLERSTFSRIQIAPPEEKGIRILVRGLVTGKGGQPVAGAKVVVFQTDARGYYAPTDSVNKRMNEPDPRLYGIVRTDKLGRFEVHTIRPANYPRKYEGRYIPQHVHFNISADGYSEMKIQAAFDDDPSMSDPHWRSWASDLGFPVMKLAAVGGIKTGSFTVVLKNN